MAKHALLSVYDKSGLVEFAQGLAHLGWQLIASGGTAGVLRQAGLIITDVSDVTGAPEMLGGRVKTLHPAVHGGILARENDSDRADLAVQGIDFIDLVACNLYPFVRTIAQPGVTLAQAIEQIDVGGVALLRAAAKNFARVTVICQPADYEAVLADLQAGGVPEARRRQLAVKAFACTRDYDTAITAYLQALTAGSPAVLPGETRLTSPLPPRLTLDLVQTQSLRYGENPHQAAALYASQASVGPLGGALLQGKALSYNNLLDLDAAWRAVTAFTGPTVVIVKHLSPCGIASAATPAAALMAALASDPLSAFGGVIAVNRPVELAFAQAIAAAGVFVEAVVAPHFSQEAQAWFAAMKKNCRLLKLADSEPSQLDVRAIRSGILVQEVDKGDPPGAGWRVVSQRQPSQAEWEAMRFAWQAVQHVKSNAIVLAAGQAAVGIGGGVSSRVDAVKLATAKAGNKARGAVMASDAFFPFPDGIEEAAKAGVTAVIEPGGSIRDNLVMETADKLGLALVFTGTRHFRH
jgi:phosphoribosylaminoimidazolecarboxamide formyltransferase/IMP cyclohydrolase